MRALVCQAYFMEDLAKAAPSEEERASTRGRRELLTPLTATRFLDCMAEVAIGHLLLEQGLIAGQRLGEPGIDPADRLFCEGKIHTVRHYLNHFLPQVFGRFRAIKQFDESAARLPEECLQADVHEPEYP